MPLSLSRQTRDQYRAAYARHQRGLRRLMLCLLIFCAVSMLGAGHLGMRIGGVIGTGVWLSLSCTILILALLSGHRIARHTGLITTTPDELRGTTLLRIWWVSHAIFVIPIMLASWFHELAPRISSLVLGALVIGYWYRQRRR